MNQKDNTSNITKEQELYFVRKRENEEKNLGYRDRDWYQCGWIDANKQNPIQKNEYGYKNNFSKNLRVIRTAFGLTMEELHNQCGVAMQTIGKYEAGDTEPTPEAKSLYRKLATS